MGALLLGVTSRRNPETTPATREQDRQDERMAGVQRLCWTEVLRAGPHT